MFLCTNIVNAQDQNDEIVITGKVLQYNAEDNGTLLEIIFEDVLEGRINKVFPIDSEGNFSFSIKRPYAQDGMLLLGENLYSFYVAPGDSQHLEINTLKDEIIFTGANAEHSRQLISYYKLINDSQGNFSVPDSVLATSTPLEFRTYITEQDKGLEEIINQFFKKYGSSDEFKAWVKQERKYRRLNDLLRYRWIKPYMSKIKRDSFYLTIPQEYFSFLSEPLLLEHSGLNTQSFYQFLSEYYNYLTMDNMPADSSAASIELFKSGNKLASFKLRSRQLHNQESQFAQDLLLSRFYHQILEWGELTAFSSLTKEHAIKEEKLNKLLQLKYAQLKMLKEREDKSNAIHFNEGLKQVEDGIIDSLVKQHSGKVLYIDFWAPWCKPCMAQLPYAKKIKEQVDSKKVVFIYLGVECKQDSWRTTIGLKEMAGEHYLLSSVQYESLKKQFKINGIPHYLVVDINGKVAMNNAPAPRSTNEVLDLLNSLTSDN
ncbi:MAG: thiol-disulfide isomerase/thioredoxin [Vicingaceae bacterium]|jgi:thiol-disulfide isomerase/thioredoxin